MSDHRRKEALDEAMDVVALIMGGTPMLAVVRSMILLAPPLSAFSIRVRGPTVSPREKLPRDGHRFDQGSDAINQPQIPRVTLTHRGQPAIQSTDKNPDATRNPAISSVTENHAAIAEVSLIFQISS
jgi:hypothetical protein